MISHLSELFEHYYLKGSRIKEQYQVIRILGKGSYGIAYLANDLRTNKKVVVKQQKKRRLKRKKNLLANEGYILKSLSHYAIPEFIDLFHYNHNLFLVMDYIEGKNVEELIFYEGKTFTEKESFHLVLKILYVLKYLHENQIAHRDIRLPNILLNGDEVFIIDFGLAVFKNPDGNEVMNEEYSQKNRIYHEKTYTSDFYDIGHFLLFLLYSNYQPKKKEETSWEEELTLDDQTRKIIRKLLNIDSNYENIQEIIADIHSYLKKETK
ncbi:protein kinase [Bacillus salitolerans]|uniref:Protein kinase n=1 Tax=Bacillus salitolerans TaxID=1437434 RepID=A0ABW4LS16_9BACI